MDSGLPTGQAQPTRSQPARSRPRGQGGSPLEHSSAKKRQSRAQSEAPCCASTAKARPKTGSRSAALRAQQGVFGGGRYKKLGLQAAAPRRCQGCPQLNINAPRCMRGSAPAVHEQLRRQREQQLARSSACGRHQPVALRRQRRKAGSPGRGPREQGGHRVPHHRRHKQRLPRAQCDGVQHRPASGCVGGCGRDPRDFCRRILCGVLAAGFVVARSRADGRT